ncbi:AcrR family transcriptional regulator [Arthrobacter woluwensis]|uniref:TetR/AcrR family transcriptional regulator n=1 Tax=Arthrobacter woluwensis TaxID=156980 RepID=UPI002782AB3D|nr:TetR/AcrR family transcriptional regulator [Arthrobacter woluwensis]MDQ0707452.1 AcrR family transcriptional regulator [Arthrobacter woluwensis]
MEYRQGGRPLRADAARNVEKIIAAARECFHERGPEVPLQFIAETAKVGPATLFRNFADKEALVLAVISRQLREHVDPVVVQALVEPDAGDALMRVIESIVQVAAEESMLLDALVGRRGVLTTISGNIIEALGMLLGRAQRQGTIRGDVSQEDVIRIVAMLIGSVDTIERGTSAWRRPVALIEDSLRPAAATRELPPQTPVPSLQLPLG